MIEKLKSEGNNSSADIFQTTDVARLNRARVEGLLLPISSPVLDNSVPTKYRDPQGYWFGQSARARVIFFSKDRVKPSDLSTFDDLASPKWKGRVCVRSSASAYNQSLLAGMIAVDGAEVSEKWAKGVVDNMARKPQGGDRDQIAAVASGQCDIAIANTYYFAGMLTSDKAEERDAANKVALFWPGQQGRGTHMNISGAGVTKSAKNKAEAIKLVEFLSGAEAQQFYAEANNEFPVLPGAKRSQLVSSWGDFKEETINVAMLGENNVQSIRIFDRVGWG
ncbi:extracellular solute-binding protein [Magnetospirillum gryphiswaldense]|uniref:Ferric iron-binding n=1 Tax=Magnetospirillum gryphiswaldense TaxID=55518 RepID=Q3BKC4_9PROT|nr:extracellular solute-binding protein [Magnetospirillum gryphiswaldense]AVM72837.1 Iron deficiency-induced protein A precursor [Magnetospirillum gryphiswaldense MSR-1]AVM76740.1 Iron deficiency-induced protein A precursor [Magnetospirillum gryphiswaldense]CAJ30104.1 ferric iron-binding [Magnetospirillum gryphiswaldense MSR-1]CAM78011.1 Ferric iron-binding, fragment [Magnetospirillum gryphiswaldense MSR-1]